MLLQLFETRRIVFESERWRLMGCSLGAGLPGFHCCDAKPSYFVTTCVSIVEFEKDDIGSLDFILGDFPDKRAVEIIHTYKSCLRTNKGDDG